VIADWGGLGRGFKRLLVYNTGKLSLTHTQLKVGTANQRHPFSPAAILLSTIQKRK